ncbi:MULTISPECIES: cell division protein ZapE [Rhizobium/Agrobacterium group]|uniref:Cell division protein ZapE n=1 Tax=Rhizobium rhizogenes TaxID=359 RepID=A0AA92H8Y8_RHIRH|nr:MULTISPECIES: cell division protein ZapE [Rhizobium/Agrobacterium group]PVE53223.1 cell division protein ZapE [Rhizobium rhizogenes]PVE63346.1 cell division protein ZapE [Agrobacterium tumefaciens]PVE72237.1 cell division protein ZapE [Sphingomonas sp. TPD3009]
MQRVPDYNHSVVEQLNALTASGELKADAAQLGVAAHLDRILSDLKLRKPAKKKSALGWMFARKAAASPSVKGLYVHGSVGRGKTMLMDMFFQMAPVEKKRRCHFHEFMADVHNRVHAHRQKLKNGETKQADPIPPVAAQLLAEAELLCFDEFTVTDIADAMILARLFTELFANGCTLVTTSNVVPDNLYKDGLNRGLFLPFIDLLKQNVEVVSLDSPIDYRMEKVKSLPVYVTPLDGAADQAMDMAWHHLTGGQVVAPVEIEMKGRSVLVPRAAGRVARFTFRDLCEKPLGASDFLAIADRFDTVFIDHIPLLSADRRNETKRFIILIDALYDHTVRLFASAAAMPEDLLGTRKGTEGFEFDRTASRLFEMRSADYLALHNEKRHAA